MSRNSRRGLLVLLGMGTIPIASCTAVGPGDGAPEVPAPAANALPDFALLDVNPESERYGEEISPRDYLGQISAWYFGHST